MEFTSKYVDEERRNLFMNDTSKGNTTLPQKSGPKLKSMSLSTRVCFSYSLHHLQTVSIHMNWSQSLESPEITCIQIYGWSSLREGLSLWWWDHVIHWNQLVTTKTHPINRLYPSQSYPTNRDSGCWQMLLEFYYFRRKCEWLKQHG